MWLNGRKEEVKLNNLIVMCVIRKRERMNECKPKESSTCKLIPQLLGLWQLDS
jgi:hypothetical protein